MIVKATRETRFVGRAVRIDSTVVEADVRYPTDSGLAADAVGMLAREGARVRRVGGGAGRVRDRSRAVGWRVRALRRALKRRTGDAKAEVLKLTGECGEQAAASLGEARRMVRQCTTRGPRAGRSGQAGCRRASGGPGRSLPARC